MSLFDGEISTEALFGSEETEYKKDVYIKHTHGHDWERQGFVGTGKDDIVEIFECADSGCDAWTAIEKPQDTRQQWRLGSPVDEDAGYDDRLEDDDDDDEIILHEHDSMEFLGSKGDTLGFLCHCGDVHEIRKQHLEGDR